MIEKVNPHNMALTEPLNVLGDLAMFLGGDIYSWTGQFLLLYAKSDPEHRRRLFISFPVHCLAHDAWNKDQHPTVGSLIAALPEAWRPA